MSDVLCPDVNDPDVDAKARQSILLLLQVAVDLYRSCVCSALLPPCSLDSPDDCVPLATLTVRTADLRVLDICNWSAPAVFTITFPTLGYWLGWLPIFDTLRTASPISVARLPRRPQFQLDEKVRVQPATFVPYAAAAAPAPAPAPRAQRQGAQRPAGAGRPAGGGCDDRHRRRSSVSW